MRCEEQNNLEIKTKSIEQTLVPLVTQITTLVNHKEKPKNSERTLRAIVRVGQAVNLAVEKFVIVGEAIADENPEIKTDMYNSCKEAKLAGCAIAKVTDIQYDDNGKIKTFADKTYIVKGARDLLCAVTKVLLLADKVVIKQLLQAKDRVFSSLHQLQKVVNFTEFVKTFSHFGSEMVNLAHLTGDRQNDLKEEKRRAQMGVARSILEKSTMMLLTSSKTCLRHPDCQPAKQNRDNVFRQMYRAMDLITYAVTDGDDMKSLEQNNHLEDIDHHPTVQGALRHFEDTIEMTRMTLVGQSTRESLESALHFITESSQDFTDSAYTPHEHREHILQLTECVKTELSSLLRIGIKMDQLDKSSSDELEVAIGRTLRASKELKKQLQNTALEQAAEIFKTSNGPEIITSIKNAGIAGDSERVEDISLKFQEYIEQLQEVCRLLKHVATTDPLIINTDHAERNIKNLGLQIIYAAKVLAIHSTSKIAKENLDVYCDAWELQINELSSLTKDIGDACQRKIEKQGYMSLPRPGRHGTTTKPLKAVKLDVEEQAKIAKLGLEMKLITSEMDAETDKWEEPENDIVKRAKNMSSMAFSMYLFTRGEGPLKTTQDLFTQAEYFAEEANKLYKTVREFSYEVPCGAQRNELLAYLDKVPTYCQQLHFTVKNPTVGKAATFNKVDSVIQETKNLMNVIAKVVTTCFICATKYNIDYRGSSHLHQNWSPHNRSFQSNGDDVESVKSTHSEGTVTSKAPVISTQSASRKHSKAHPIFGPFRI